MLREEGLLIQELVAGDLLSHILIQSLIDSKEYESNAFSHHDDAKADNMSQEPGNAQAAEAYRILTLKTRGTA